MLTTILSTVDIYFVFLVFVGSVLGMLVGVLPGLSAITGTALLVSLTFTWDVKDALAMMMGVYVLGVYAGAITAILMNIPGAPAAVATTLDGFPLAQKGHAKTALWAASIYSCYGSIFGLMVLVLVAKPITKIALEFSSIDYFLLALFGLTTVGSLTSGNFIKGLISAMLGVFLSTVGIDPMTGVQRFTFGSLQLQGGVPVVPVLIGLFGFSEVLYQSGAQSLDAIAVTYEKSKIKIRMLFTHFWLATRSSVIGTLVGALPGAGAPVASLLSYDSAKRTIKNPTVPFGKGAVEGVVASETANNACIGGALIPMLTLGIPGDAVTAIILSAFYIHGLRPGPLLLTETPQLFHVIIIAGLIACIFIFLLGLTLGPLLARVVTVPKRYLLPIVTILCIIGAYAANTSLFEVNLMILFGLIGYFMRVKGYSPAPMVLGLVLGQLMDSSFRRAINLSITEGNIIINLFSGPISIFLIACIIISVLSNVPILRNSFKKYWKKIFRG